MSDLLEQHRRMVAQGMNNLGIVTPDEAAQKHEAARKLGVPVQAVYDAPKESLIAVTVRNMWDGTRDAPGLREALGAEDFYRVANDDVQALSAVEVAARNASLMGVAGRAVPDPLGEMRAAPDAPWYKDVYDSFARGWHNARAAEGLQGNFITDSIHDARRQAAESAGVSYDADVDKAVYYLEQKRRAGRYAPDASLYAQQAGYAELNAREASFGELFGYLRENPGFVFNTVSESMGANAPGMARTAAAGFVNPLAAAAMAGSSSFDVEYNATVAEGVEAEAGKYGGGIRGVVNALGNRDAMAAAEGKAVRRGSAVGLFDGLTAGFGGQIIKGARSLWGAVPRVVGEGAVQAGGGAAGEAAAQALTGEYKPGDILMEAVAEIPTGAFEAHGNYREAVRNIQAERARRDREHLDLQTANTQASKLTARAPDMQAEFVNKGYGDAARIYVDADALMQSGRAAEVAEKIPGAAEKIAEAVQSGGAVELTRGEYHAFLSAEAQQDLNAHIRATPEAMSAEEARQWAESGEQEAMRSEVEAEAANLAAAESASSERKAAFARELSGTGLVNRKQAQAYAAYYVGSVENLAQRLGMSPEAFEERYGRLSVSGESLIEDGVLNQALASAPPKGWVHSTNPQDVIGLWDDTTSARAIFWTGIDNQVAVEAADASDYSHSISADVVRHIKNRHGNDADGQLPVTAEDLVKIPEIIANYDEVRTNLQNPKTGGQRVAYAKRSEDSLLIYLEEYVRSRNNLKGVSMWKYPPTADVGNVLAHITRPSLYVRNGVAAYDNTTADTGSNQDVLFQSATEEARQFEEVAAQYGSEAAYEQAKADGETVLTYRQWVQVRTPAFKEWFGDWENDPDNASKVVNPKTGEPLVVYHGTDVEFNVFDRNKTGSNTDNGMRGKGFYMATDRRTAEGYGNRLIESFADLKKPFYPSDFESAEAIAQYLTGELEAKGFDEYTVDEAMFKIRDGRFTVGQSYSGTFASILKDAGFDGVVYQKAEEVVAFRPNQIKSATDNSGAFSADNDSILFQSSVANDLPDGVRGFYDRTGRTVTLLKNADASTFIHESGHYYLDLLGRIYQDLAGREGLTDAEAQVVADFETLLAWSGVKDAQAWFGMEAEAQRVYHEKIARAFEAYVFEGKAPDSRLREVFARMARWMRQVYRSLAGLDVELSDEVRGVFDRLLASDDAIAEAEYVNHMRPLLKEGDFADAGAWQAYRAANEAAHAAAADELGAKAVRDMRFARNLRSDVLRKLRRRHKADLERAEMAARRNIMRQPVYRAWQFLTAKIGEEDRIGESESVRKAKVLQGAPVYTVSTRIAPKDNKGLLEWAAAQFEQAGGKAYHPEIGEVLLDRKSVKNSMAHGMNPFKASAFEAVPAVIEKGVVVARTEHGRTSSFFVSAPVRIEGVETVVTVLVRRDMNKQSMYLHSVQNKEKILNTAVNESAADAGASEPHGKLHSGYMESLLRKYLTDKLPDRKGGRVLDPSRDSLMAAVAKLGGIGREEAVREWGVDVKDNFRVGILPVLRENGRSIDAMAEALAEEGYLPTDSYGKADVRDLEERFSDGLKGRDYFSIHYVPREEVKPGAELANPYALTAARLDAASLDGIPQGWSEVLSARGMVAKKGGLHPDIAAELVLDEDGRPVFPTGEDLLRALVEAEPPQEAIENTAYLNLLAQFGEVPTAADFEAAADAAAHNGLRLRILAAEFAALKKETGSVSYLKRAAGLIAREKLEAMKAADVRPHVFASAEARAGRQAEKAFSKGDTAQAAEFKRRQLVQSAMAREAYRVREEMEKTHRYLSGFRRVKTGIDLEYRQQIDALLSAVGLKQAAASEEVPSLHALLAKMEEDGRPHNLDAEMFNALSRKDYRDMTVGEVRDLADQVRQLEFLGRNKNKMLASKAKLDYEAVRDEITASVRANSSGRTARTRTAATKFERSADRVRGFFWGHLKLSAIARILDGGKDAGPVWQYLVRPINEAGDAEAARMAEMTEKLAAVMKPLEQALKKQRGKKQYAGIGGLTRQQLFAMALNTGNEGNLQRLLSGGFEMRRNLDINAVRAALSDLTADEWHAVQAVWDLFESMRPEVAELERRTTGTEPKWVEASPMTVRTSDGQEVELRGGYYPIGYDPKGSMAAEQQAAASEAKADWSAAKMAASTRGGYVKDRAAKVENRPVLLNLSVVYNGLNDIIHDLTHRAAVADANRLLRSYSIDAAVRETLGAEALRQMRAAVRDVARGHGDVQAMDGMAGMMRHGVGMAGLGFNLVSAAIQITGFVPAIARIGGKYTAVGLSAWLSNPWAAARSANEQSDFMANRSRTRFRELNEVANTLNGNKVRLFLSRYAYWLMMKVQQVVDTVVWHGALAKALSEGHGQESAARLADQAVLDTQGGGQVKDQSALERGGNLSKLFTVFYSYMNAALNQGVVQIYTQQDRMRLAAELLLIWVIPNVLTVLMKEALVPGDDGEDLAKKLAKEQISFMLGLFVGARELSSLGAIVTGSKDFGYSGVGGTRVISDALRFTKQARQGEADEAFVRASINFSGSLFGLPAAQANRSLKGYRALKEGKTDNPAALLFGYEGK